MQGDTHSYVRPALALFEDGRFSSGPGDSRPEFLRTPGYPAFAAVYGVFGDDRAPVLLAQVVLSVLTVFLVALPGARLWSPAVGLVAAVLVCLEPLQLYTAGTLLTESLATLLLILLAVVGFFVFAGDKPRFGVRVLLGVTISLATMVRPVTTSPCSSCSCSRTDSSAGRRPGPTSSEWPRPFSYLSSSSSGAGSYGTTRK